MEKLTRKLERVNGNGLELYHSYQSFYSQKVVFTLNEKKLTFQSKILDIYKFEQYEPWYLKLNPRAEVPVLKDEVKIIPDSTRIIDYLEDNFSNGDIPRLTPEKGTDQWVKMKNLREMLDDVPIKLLTFGALWHPDQTIKSSTSITDAQRKQRLSLYESLPMKLDELIKSHPEYSQSLKEKKANLQECLNIKDIEKFKDLLVELGQTLDIVEKEIESGSKDNPNWWLCSDSFTLADISLTMLLGRLKYLGLFDRYASKRPMLKKYFTRAQLRDSYKRATRHGSVTVLEKMPCKHILSYALGSIVLLGLLVTATILYKRLK